MFIYNLKYYDKNDKSTQVQSFKTVLGDKFEYYADETRASFYVPFESNYEVLVFLLKDTNSNIVFRENQLKQDKFVAASFSLGIEELPQGKYTLETYLTSVDMYFKTDLPIQNLSDVEVYLNNFDYVANDLLSIACLSTNDSYLSEYVCRGSLNLLCNSKLEILEPALDIVAIGNIQLKNPSTIDTYTSNIYCLGKLNLQCNSKISFSKIKKIYWPLRAWLSKYASYFGNNLYFLEEEK